MDFTKEKVLKLADLLMIGLTEEETNMVFDEFEIIDKNINDIEPMTHAIDNFDYVLREDVADESITKDELLQNSDNNDGDNVVIPKVVG